MELQEGAQQSDPEASGECHCSLPPSPQPLAGLPVSHNVVFSSTTAVGTPPAVAVGLRLGGQCLVLWWLLCLLHSISSTVPSTPCREVSLPHSFWLYHGWQCPSNSSCWGEPGQVVHWAAVGPPAPALWPWVPCPVFLSRVSSLGSQEAGCHFCGGC